MYRGYAITDLCKNCAYEEVSYLLLYGSLPTKQQLQQYIKRLATYRTLPPALLASIELIPQDTHPMIVMNCLCNLYGAHFPEQLNDEKNPVESKNALESADRLLASLGPMLLYWQVSFTLTPPTFTTQASTSCAKSMHQLHN
jgi:2-methylcitrate synthase